ncbi:DUF2189 domain-containing protein [Williamsia sterculiae]|uniref:Uncharacterized membrane protein n=1 Tax=Williamsia sterculiae TaxID=1344003 RepID=A0A1N7F7B8_9NOCA|nr:hypothetical protein [Williamsia sterculiae]SIR96125.1 Uncharacterized membrane protein [Williamsia sterculiae]
MTSNTPPGNEPPQNDPYRNPYGGGQPGGQGERPDLNKPGEGYPQQGYPQGSYPQEGYPQQGSYPPPGQQGGYPSGSYPPPPGQYPPQGQPGYGGFPGGNEGLAPSGQFSIGDALSYGWNKYKSNAGSWIAVILLGVVVSAIINFAFSGFDVGNVSGGFTLGTDSDVSVGTSILSIIGSVVSFVVSTLFQAAYTRGALSEVDGTKPSVGAFFRFHNVVTVIVVSIIVGLLTGVGFILFILPGIIVAYLTYYSLTFVIDRQQGAIDGIKSSFRLTTQNVGQLLPLAIVCVLLNIVGFLVCLVGLLVTVPVTLIAGVYAYRTLTQGPVSPPTV